jgi:hypothetical protein
MNGKINLALMVLLTFNEGENDKVLPVCPKTEEFHFITGLSRLCSNRSSSTGGGFSSFVLSNAQAATE